MSSMLPTGVGTTYSFPILCTSCYNSKGKKFSYLRVRFVKHLTEVFSLHSVFVTINKNASIFRGFRFVVVILQLFLCNERKYGSIFRTSSGGDLPKRKD